MIFPTIFAQRCIQNVLKTTHFSSESPSNNSKKYQFSYNLHATFYKNCYKYHVQRNAIPPNKILQCSISPKPSSKVYSMFANNTIHFKLSQTCGDGEISCFTVVRASFCSNSAEITCKKLYFSEYDEVFCGAWENFCVGSETLKLHSKTSLGSGLSVETNVMIIRCMNHFLLRQT